MTQYTIAFTDTSGDNVGRVNILRKGRIREVQFDVAIDDYNAQPSIRQTVQLATVPNFNQLPAVQGQSNVVAQVGITGSGSVLSANVQQPGRMPVRADMMVDLGTTLYLNTDSGVGGSSMGGFVVVNVED
jgi:hypothetical protein